MIHRRHAPLRPISSAIQTSGNFTATLTGYASGPTGTLNWIKNGTKVHLWAPSAITGTSNAATLTITGLPSAIQPTDNKSCVCSHITDNSVALVAATAIVSSSTITLAKLILSSGIYRYSTTGWTASGTKGVGASWAITYSVD